MPGLRLSDSLLEQVAAYAADAVSAVTIDDLIVDGGGRRGLFGSAVPAPPQAGPGDRLIALLGRTPR